MAIDPHFDSDMKFKLIELDPVTGLPLSPLSSSPVSRYSLLGHRKACDASRGLHFAH
jgi:hypothetical protein